MIKKYFSKILHSVYDKKYQYSIYDKKIRLLIELDTFDKGGLQKVVLDSALRLNPKHFDVTIVSVNGEGFLFDKAKDKGISVYALPKFQKIEYYEKIIKRHKINLSNSHFSRMGYPLFKRYSIPNITFIHNVYAFLRNEALDNFIRDDQYIDLYISVSKKATTYAIDKFNISSDKVVTIPNGLIIDEHSDKIRNAVQLSRESFGIKDSDYVFLNPASYNLHKGHYVMVDAMNKILKYRDDIKILCIGNVVYKPHYYELIRHLRDNGLSRHILLPGYFPNIESIYPIVDAFLMPSFIEGWSIAMNEAMFYQKPMIMTDTGGASEVIINNDIGILIKNEYGDITNLYSEYLDDMAYNWRNFKISDSLSNAMIEFANNREYWRKAGKKGKEKIINRFNFDTIVTNYEKIFTDILN